VSQLDPPGAPYPRDPGLTGAIWEVPAGRPLDLPGRGTTFVREVPGPGPHAPVLMLLHGLAATGGVNWYTAFEALGRHYRVIAVDHRGHGRGIRSPARFRLADCADDAVAVADALGIDRFVPVGYSMGGPIAQLIWHRHRRRVQALVLCATARNFRGTVRERVEFFGLGMLLVAKWRVPAADQVRNIVEDLLTPDFGSPALRQWILDELHRNDTRTVMEAAEALGRYSSHQWIDQIDVPVSVVVPDHDGLVPVRRQLKLARALPTAVLFPIHGDHLVSARDPEAFVPALVDACELAVTRSSSFSPGRSATGADPDRRAG